MKTMYDVPSLYIRTVLFILWWIIDTQANLQTGVGLRRLWKTLQNFTSTSQYIVITSDKKELLDSFDSFSTFHCRSYWGNWIYTLKLDVCKQQFISLFIIIWNIKDSGKDAAPLNSNRRLTNSNLHHKSAWELFKFSWDD